MQSNIFILLCYTTYNTHLHQLIVLQKRIIRIIFLLTPLS